MAFREQPDRQNETRERFLRLLLPVRDRLMQFARAMTRNREEADDLVSDTILAALERFDDLRSPAAFLGYLFTIAVRIHKRRRWRERLFGSYDEEYAESIPSNATAPDISADVAMLYKALDQLPERQRETVVLFELSDLSLEEIRAIQGGSLSGVKSRLVRGREKLAQILNTADRTAPGFAVDGMVPAAGGRRREGSFLIFSESQNNG